MAFPGAEDTISIGADATHLSQYWLATVGKQTLLKSADRILQGVPSDDFQHIWTDWRELGRGWFAGDDLMTIVPGKLNLRPTVTTLAVTNGEGLVLDSIPRYGEMEIGSFKYIICHNLIIKVYIGAGGPYVVDQYGPFYATSPWDANDTLGQPVQGYSARATAGYRWYVPLNNGNRIMALDALGSGSVAYSPVVTLNGTINSSTTTVTYTSAGDPIAYGDIFVIDSESFFVVSINTGTNVATVIRGYAGTTAASHTTGAAITKGTRDTWTARTAVVGGASHFKQLPSGKIWRSVATSSAGVAVKVAQVSSILAGSDFEADASWSEDYPVDDQTAPITSLMCYDELLVVGKTNGWFSAVQNADLTLTWRNVLPDAAINVPTYDATTWDTTTGKAIQPWHRGAAWHGDLYLTSQAYTYRSNINNARPVSPDSVPENTGDETATLAKRLMYGNIQTLVSGDEALFAIYSDPLNAFSEVLMAQESGQAIPSWELLFKATGNNGEKAQLIDIQRSGSGSPKLFVGSFGSNTVYLDIIQLSRTRWPLAESGTLGNISKTARLYLPPLLLPTQVLFREWQFLIENGDANCAWGLEYALDGGAALTTIATTVTGSGQQSVYFTPGTNDSAEARIMAIIKNVTNGSFVPKIPSSSPRLVSAGLYGFYQPKVSDDVICTIDLVRTAVERSVTVESVIAELEAFRLTQQYYLDRFGTAGRIFFRHTDFGVPTGVQGLVGEAYMQCNFTIVPYA